MKNKNLNIQQKVSRFVKDVFLDNISNAESDTNRFLVQKEDGSIAFRTGEEILSDIGGSSTDGDITSVVAGTNLTGGGTSGDVTINLADASTSAKGAASFSSSNFSVSSGAVSIKAGGVDLTDEVTGTLPIAKGGTGTTSYIDNQVVAYNAGTGKLEGHNVFVESPASNVYKLKIGDGSSTSAILGSENGAPLSVSVDLATGANVAGSDLTFTAGLSTGTAAGGNIIFKSSSTGSSGSIPNTNSELVRITGAGNVGIGTTSPGNKLEVNSGTTNVAGVFKSSDNQAWISVQDDDSGTYGALFGTDSDAGHDIILADSSANKRLVIDADGQVGIGATTPTARLHVESVDDAVIRLKSTDNKAYIALSDNDSNGYISSENSKLSLGASVGVNANNLNIDLSNNNVGIGTSSPASLLEINQQLSAAATIDYPYIISSRDDDNSINQIGGEGVGIKFRIAGNATTTPGDSLVGASIAAIREMSSDADSSTGLGLFVTQNDETLDEAVRVDHDGNVGIGTTSPSEKLDVVGDIKLSGDIELGHADDTTIARSAAGKATIEGREITTNGSSGTNFITFSTNGYVVSATSGEVHIGHSSYGNYHFNWGGVTVPTSGTRQVTKNEVNCGWPVPVNLSKVEVRVNCRTNGSSDNLITQCFKTASELSGNTTVTAIGSDATVTGANQNQFNDMTITDGGAVSAGEVIYVGVGCTNGTPQLRFNITILGYVA